ncbi:MAG TPA: DUF1501 domain-containing protein [Tepidisphaeraceae bacterium]|nr:DUF1501 domain-containing protein [Tepidisphaeraceae bacterium]
MLSRCASGFGAIALAAMMNSEAAGAVGAGPDAAPRIRLPHFRPRAKNIIFLYMDGGPSQVDTFDYKPMLEKYDGQDPHKAMGKLEPTQFANIGKVMASPWKFKQYGQSGSWVSDLFPHVATVVDELAFVRSMTSDFSEHTNANFFLHTGSGQQGRPSMGAWTTYGLGSSNKDLPGFVVVNGGLIPPGGLDCFSNGFLPATFQGSVFKPGMPGVANAQRLESSPAMQQRKLALMRKLDAGMVDQIGHVDSVESAIANYELAYQMQAAVPELMDLSGETEATKKLYGLDGDYPQTRIFATECLLARRMIERGVRFIELTCPGGNGDRWDQHSGLRDGHTKNCKTVDQPIAALIKDLKSRGLLDETLVVWAGEFGRTPFAQGSDGRDHNPYGYTLWMAGGGIKGGTVFGSTDDWGYKAAENKVNIHDLHATMLALLGIQHTKLTFRFSGRDIRLTDVYGDVMEAIIA